MHRTLLFLFIVATGCSSEDPAASGDSGGTKISGECPYPMPATCSGGDSCGVSDHCGIGSSYECAGGAWISTPRACDGSSGAANKGCGAARVTPGSACTAGDGPCAYGCKEGGNMMEHAECKGGIWTLVDGC